MRPERIRLRDTNQEKKLRDQLQKRARLEQEWKEARKKKLEKLQETPKHVFSDDSLAR